MMIQPPEKISDHCLEVVQNAVQSLSDERESFRTTIMASFEELERIGRQLESRIAEFDARESQVHIELRAANEENEKLKSVFGMLEQSQQELDRTQANLVQFRDKAAAFNGQIESENEQLKRQLEGERKEVERLKEVVNEQNEQLSVSKSDWAEELRSMRSFLEARSSVVREFDSSLKSAELTTTERKATHFDAEDESRPSQPTEDSWSSDKDSSYNDTPESPIDIESTDRFETAGDEENPYNFGESDTNDASPKLDYDWNEPTTAESDAHSDDFDSHQNDSAGIDDRDAQANDRGNPRESSEEVDEFALLDESFEPRTSKEIPNDDEAPDEFDAFADDFSDLDDPAPTKEPVETTPTIDVEVEESSPQKEGDIVLGEILAQFQKLEANVSDLDS